MNRAKLSRIFNRMELVAVAAAAVLFGGEALADQTTSCPWVIQGTSSWARWAPAPYLRWDAYNDLNGKVQLVAEPGTRSAVFFLNADGSVGYRNVDQNTTTTFPGIQATHIAVGYKSRLWALTPYGMWARWAPAPYNRWDYYYDLDDKVQIVGDPTSEAGVFFLNADGSVGYRNVDQDITTTFPGIQASQIAVGYNGRLWAITTNGMWARWAPAPYNRWDYYYDLDDKVQIVGDPTSEGGIYFRNADGSIGYRNIDLNVDASFPGWNATELTVSDVAP
ncbi:hypothetical protein HPC49_02780 [Pyxidicoccus fallax]|uniref:Uncharacterized protein n=1 Tax=Pyxidicoccus fallax TaxID=394095 RepID=A0A848L3H9_9BACT|nr:hypothetical protein [Pyxidicoccus fallax]NMO13274.1 hypothetical protein [Pyxidicoccus fallax]NPC77180.1 hypothetical protein [Pyxidicoccus fallax]